MMKVTDVNNLKREEFTKIFGNVVEYFPKIAVELFSKIPFRDVYHLVETAMQFLDDLSLAEKKSVLKLHPDLAGKLADEGKLTTESTQEQKSADLDKLSPEKKKEIYKLNNEYKDKFGFPFVICARENKTEAILSGLRQRLKNTKEEEITTGTNEVKKICKLRILDIAE